MVFLGELRVEATLESLRTISYFVHGIGQRLRLTEETLFDIDVAVEEASANIINHAYSAGRAGEILVRLETMNDVLRITLTDWGLPLDPSNVRPFDMHAPIETRIKGGTGLHLIHSLMDAVVRQVAPVPGGPNTVTLRKHIERLEPQDLSAQYSDGIEHRFKRHPGHGDQH